MFHVLIDRFGIVAIRSERTGLVIVSLWRLFAIVANPRAAIVEFAICDGPTARWPIRRKQS